MLQSLKRFSCSSFFKKFASSVLSRRLQSTDESQIRIPFIDKTTNLIRILQVFKCPPYYCTTDESNTGTEDELSIFAQPQKKALSEKVKKLVPKALRCGDLYNKQGKNITFTEELDTPNLKTMRVQLAHFDMLFHISFYFMQLRWLN